MAAKMSIKDMKKYLLYRGVDYAGVREKSELLELVHSTQQHESGRMRPSGDLSRAVSDVVAAVRDTPFAALAVANDATLQRRSLFDEASVERAAVERVLKEAEGDLLCDRAAGAMVGMAVADSLGHMFEFLPARDEVNTAGPYFEYPCEEHPGGRVHRENNQFRLKPGQWTDDASMGLCMADSLLVCDGYNGSNIRIWFWNWWFNGLNNAFRLDTERANMFMGDSLSVGLGGNISQSLMEMEGLSPGQPIPPRFVRENEDAGNGSLMRLAPIPLWFHSDISEACAMAYESSLTTHPGPLAAEACAFYTYAIVRALHRPGDCTQTAAQLIDDIVKEYLAILEERATAGTAESQRVLRRLLLSQEDGTERCWNWRDSNVGIEDTLRARGSRYNGYPVSAGYFGAFSIDGLAIALHSVYHTTSFNEAIAKCINFLGDADTTGAIAAQFAGAFYGAGSIDKVWLDNLRTWDADEVALRAVCLVVAGADKRE